MARPLVALFLLLSAPACDDAGISDEAVTLRPGGYGCSVCGLGLGNAPTVNTSAVHEFSLDGTVNADGVRLLRGEDPLGNWLTLGVEPTHGRWIAGGDADDVAPRTGAAMVARANLAQRQATVRMITADYCGIGVGFTASGVPVAWRDAAGFVAPPYAEDALEAKWGPDGALCLDTPRFASGEQIGDGCEIPRCDGDAMFTSGVVWRTMLP